MCILVRWISCRYFTDLSFYNLQLADDCLVFLEECVKHKVIIVPGVFFDINPRHIRNLKKSKCISFVRFSYGPAMENLEKGLNQIGQMIEYWKTHQESPEMYAQESLE